MTDTAAFNARVYSSKQIEELKEEMAKVGSEWQGVEHMAPKARHFVIKVHGLRNPAVLILKEEMLAKGGDCAIHRNAIVGRAERSDCLLMGTERAYSSMLKDLRAQPFELARLADEIQAAIDNYVKPFPSLPHRESLSKTLQRMYLEMEKRTLIMGILNTTPDSFSDGGMHASAEASVEHGLLMASEGADIIDVGGESTRPGAEPVSPEEEISRVVPVIRELAGKIKLPISIDTFKPEVARAALDAGASIINDITGLGCPKMRGLAAERRVPSIIMHMKGTPQTMQQNPSYEDVVSEVMAFLRERIAEAVEAGLPEEFIIIDPGVGFGKTVSHNLAIIRELADFKAIGRPILLATSRKGFIGKITGVQQASERVEGTAATVALGIANGANIVRVHDVREMTRVARMADAVARGV